ncbi:hypothetical protein [Streptomyces sp. NPDC018045]|uniref:hypothetical protein n=1 Tax=Streptomyces sp. NPDC018045 TaxID=3365037 RepID=UPI003798F258
MAVGCAVLAAVASWSDFLLVVAHHVIPGWLVGAAFLAISSALVLIRTVRRRSAPDRAREKGTVTGRWILAFSVVAAGLGSALGAVGDLGAEYRMLEPRGPGGCQAVTRETAFLYAGSGDVYSVGAGGIGRPTGHWTADDGLRPIAAGSYGLSWGDDSGSLMIHGTATDPVRPALHDVDCG